MWHRSSLALVLSLFCLPTAIPAEPSAIPAGFHALFNGKDLTGWQVLDGKIEVWGAENGLLYVKGGGGGWLMTDKEYADFELRLEYKMPKKGNSGVGLRAPKTGNPAFDGMEIQLLDDAGWEGAGLKPAQYTGSIYGVVPPSKHVAKPAGEWNKMRITAKGRKITVELNDTVIVDANLDEHKEHIKEHPGIQRTKGRIGLQSYNYRVDFRNLIIREL